ncbi:hypothetical protein PspLS_05735 [Pyricularia sp. CBS 133598]|nr:hypothetical protein PspLS_05735 [Pyricularia sp. CBS 133598]
MGLLWKHQCILRNGMPVGLRFLCQVLIFGRVVAAQRRRFGGFSTLTAV